MKDDVTDIASHYDSDPSREHDRLVAHQLEFDLTWRILERHLPPGARILELGAATGRYTVRLAQAGYSVVATDLSKELIATLRTRVAEAGVDRSVESHTLDARDLSHLQGETFDAVLVMGPLYHLTIPSDRDLVLRQAYSRLREGGIIFSAHLSRLAVLSDLIRNKPDWITQQESVRALLDHGTRPHAAPRGGFRGYFSRTSEIVPSYESVGFEKITLAAVEPVIAAHDESYNILTGDERAAWLDLLDEVCTDPSILGASRHLLYVGRKVSAPT